MYKTLFYDFKRGFFKPVTLLFLVLFAATGIGLASLVQSRIAQMGTGAFMNVLLLAVDLTENKSYVLGYVYTVEEDQVVPIRGVLSYKVSCTNGTDSNRKIEVVKGETTFDGLIEEEKPLSANTTSLMQDLERVSCQVEISIYTARGGRGYTGFQTPYLVNGRAIISYSVNLVTSVGPSAALLYDIGFARTDSKVNIVVALLSLESEDFEANLYLKELPAGSAPQFGVGPSGVVAENPEGKGFINVGVVRSRKITVLQYDLSNTNTTSVEFIIAKKINGNYKYYAYRSAFLNVVGGISAIIRQSLVYILTTIALSLFAAFSPLIPIYLVNVYIAKPRSQGALEFVLARPITRLDIYMSRFLAGILVVVAATTLFYTAVMAGVKLSIGIALDLYANVLLYLSLLLPLVAFYSVCYFLATLVRGARYLALSIVVFVLFKFLLSVIATAIILMTYGGLYTPEVARVSAKTEYVLKYLNPLGIGDLVQYYVYEHYNMTSAIPYPEVVSEFVNPWYIGVAVAGWICIPAAIGWLRFKKANLAS